MNDQPSGKLPDTPREGFRDFGLQYRAESAHRRRLAACAYAFGAFIVIDVICGAPILIAGYAFAKHVLHVG